MLYHFALTIPFDQPQFSLRSKFSFCKKHQKHFVLLAYVLICLIMTKVHSEFFQGMYS